MADRNKFEQMLEKLVNEDKKGAEELFHEIVVEKSRTIYENLLEDELAATVVPFVTLYIYMSEPGKVFSLAVLLA